MDFFSVLALLGGLAIFLYGMNLMGDGLAKVAGGKLVFWKPLHRARSERFF